MLDFTLAEAAATILLVLLCVPVVYFELRNNTIPNAVTYPGILAGLLIAVLFRRHDILNYLSAFALAFGVFYAFNLLGWIGGGDVKLMAMIGMLMGLRFLLHALVYISLAGGLAAIAVAAYRLVRRKPLRGATIPYGTAIVAGTYVCILERIL